MDIAEVRSTGPELAEVFRDQRTDALVFPSASADLVRTVRLSNGTSLGSQPAMIVAVAPVSAAHVVRAATSGFHGVVSARDLTDPPASVIEDFVSGRRRLLDDPALARIRLTPGLLARPLVLEQPIDEEIADLIGLGLPDEDIALATGHSLQTVRNRIEGLLNANQLDFRTQLVVMRASRLSMPEVM